MHTLCNMFEPAGGSLHQLKFGVFFTKALNIIITKHMTVMMMMMVMKMMRTLVNNCDDAVKKKSHD